MIAQGYLRSDGRKGIRNVLIVAYLVECAHHVARRIVESSGDPDVHLIGFPGCYPNDYALRMMKALATHPNVGGVLLLSLGCEGFNREELARYVEANGRAIDTIVIQQAGGTRVAGHEKRGGHPQIGSPLPPRPQGQELSGRGFGRRGGCEFPPRW